MRLSHRMLHWIRISIDKERLDWNNVPLYREGPQQQLGEAPRLLGIRIGTPLLGYVAGNAGQGTSSSVHHLVDARGRSEKAGEVAHRQLDAVENVRQRSELP